MRVFSLLALSLLLPGAALAGDLGAMLRAAPGQATFELSEDATAENIVVAGRRVAIKGRGDASPMLRNASGRPLFSVGEGGDLTLDFLSLRTDDAAAADVAIYVQGGKLTLKNCVLETRRRFGVYLRGGELVLEDCRLEGGDTALALTEGATGAVRAAEINDATASGLWVSGKGAAAELENVTIAYGRRGVAVDKGAVLSATGLSVYSTSEIGVFLSGGGATLSDLYVEGSEKYGLFAQAGASLSVDGGAVHAAKEVGAVFNDAGAVTLDRLQMSQVKNGFSVKGGRGEIRIKGVRSSLSGAEGAHIIASGARLALEGGAFEGGRNGVSLSKGALSLEGAEFAGQTQSAVYADAGEPGSLRIKGGRFVARDDAVAVYSERPLEVVGATFVYEKAALAGKGAAALLATGNLFVGPDEAAPVFGDMSGTISFANRRATVSQYREPWGAVRSAADFQSRQKAFELLFEQLGEPSTQEGAARIALLETELSQALAPGANVALGRLIRLDAGGGEADLGVLRVGDLPLEVSPGAYALLGPSGEREEFELAKSRAEYWLSAPEPAGPYALFIENKQPRRGADFALRPAHEIAALLQSAWPGYHQHQRMPTPRPGVDEAARAAAIAAARADIEPAIAWVKALPSEIDRSNMPDDVRKEVSRLVYTITFLPRQTFSAAASEADADWLTREAASILGGPGDELAVVLLRSAAEAELRLGLIADGQAARLFAGIGPAGQDARFPALATELARRGHEPAIEALIEALATRRLGANWPDGQANAAFGAVAHIDHPDVTALALEIVDQFAASSFDVYAGREGVGETSGVSVNSAIVKAFLNAAAFAREEDRARLRIGLPKWATLAGIGAAFENPLELLAHFLGRDEAQPTSAYNYQLVSQFCEAAVARRDLADLHQGYRQLLSEYGARFPKDIQLPGHWGGWLSDLALAHCRLSSGAMRQLKNRKSDERQFAPAAWGYAFHSPADSVEELVGGKPDYFPNIGILDNAPEHMAEAALQMAPATAGMARYNVYRSVATIAHDMPVGPYGHSGLTAAFLQPFQKVKSGYEEFWLAGRVHLAPARIGEQLVFGLRLDLKGVSHQGLAAAIARHPEIIAANTARDGLAALESVTLRHGQSQSPLRYLNSLPGGLHLFALPGGVEDRANLIVDMRFQLKGLDGEPLNAWTTSIPLYRSAWAYRQVRETGRIDLSGSKGTH